MRTKCLTVFKFNELSTEAKETVKNKLTSSQYWSDYIFSDAGETLRIFCNLFDIKYRNIDFLEPYRNDYKIKISEEVLKLSGIRLMKYLYSNYYADLFTPKYIGHIKNPTEHNRIKIKRNSNFYAYYSGVQKTTDCVLTGVCYDYSVLKPIYDFLRPGEFNGDFEDLINACISNLCKDVENEYISTFEDSFISEYCEANNIEFTKAGDIF